MRGPDVQTTDLEVILERALTLGRACGQRGFWPRLLGKPRRSRLPTRLEVQSRGERPTAGDRRPLRVRRKSRGGGPVEVRASEVNGQSADGCRRAALGFSVRLCRVSLGVAVGARSRPEISAALGLRLRMSVATTSRSGGRPGHSRRCTRRGDYSTSATFHLKFEIQLAFYVMSRENPQDSVSRVDSPRAALVVTIEVDVGGEAEFNRWYNEKHVPERLAMKGFVSARRYLSADNPRRYLAVYELESPEAANGSDYMEAARALETEWDRSVAKSWKLLGREVWSDISVAEWGPAPG